MGKSEKSVIENSIEDAEESQLDGSPRLSYEEQLLNVNIIAKPMATKKLAKRIYKLLKKAHDHKKFLQGLKAVQAGLRKGEQGVVVLAGDVTPIDILCHLPAVCEEKKIDYIYTPSKKDIGLAMGLQGCCIVVLVKEHPDYKDLYDDCLSRMRALFGSTFPN